MRADRDFIDYAIVAAAFASPLIAWITARQAIKQHDKRRLEFQLSWIDYELTEQVWDSYLCLRVHNRSTYTIAIRDLRFARGIFPRQLSWMTCYDAQNGDYPFPVELKPDEVQRFPIDSSYGRVFFEKLRVFDFLLWTVGVSISSIVVSTTKGECRKRFKLPTLLESFRPKIGNPFQ